MRNIKYCIAVVFLVVGLSACSIKEQEFTEATVVEPVYYEHTIKYSGETLGLVAKWYTESAENWRMISDVNPQIDIRRMSIGQVVRIPDYLIRVNESMPQSFVSRFNLSQQTESGKVKASEAQSVLTVLDVLVKTGESKQKTAKSDASKGSATNVVNEADVPTALVVKEQEPTATKGVNVVDDSESSSKSKSKSKSSDEVDRNQLLEELLK